MKKGILILITIITTFVLTSILLYIGEEETHNWEFNQTIEFTHSGTFTNQDYKFSKKLIINDITTTKAISIEEQMNYELKYDNGSKCKSTTYRALR